MQSNLKVDLVAPYKIIKANVRIQLTKSCRIKDKGRKTERVNVERKRLRSKFVVFYISKEPTLSDRKYACMTYYQENTSRSLVQQKADRSSFKTIQKNLTENL